MSFLRVPCHIHMNPVGVGQIDCANLFAQARESADRTEGAMRFGRAAVMSTVSRSGRDHTFVGHSPVDPPESETRKGPFAAGASGSGSTSTRPIAWLIAPARS